MLYAVLSDIHGNLFALESVVRDMQSFDISSVILLGDLIDYGMQSNEAVRFLRDSFDYDISCNIWGNHERAIMLADFERFSSPRGEQCAKHTAQLLADDVKLFLDTRMTHEGKLEFTLDDKKCLAVHASLDDVFWKAVMPENVRGDYKDFDIVFSGHSHYPHAFAKFYETCDPKRRNKHAALFVNPGSVGQPRNHDPQAQYAIFDSQTQSVMMRRVKYPVDKAMSLYDGSVDDFYRARLEYGV